MFISFAARKSFSCQKKRKDRVHPLPKCGKICYNILALLEGNRAGTHARQPLRFASSSALLLPTPAPHALRHGRSHPIPQRHPSAHAESPGNTPFPPLPSPARVFPPSCTDQRPFFPHLPDLSPVILRHPHCIEASRDSPFGTFPIHRTLSENKLPLHRTDVSKKFFAGHPDKNKLADR